jgi:hypothetical protein
MRERFVWFALKFVAFVFCLNIGAVLLVAQSTKVDVSGVWVFTVESAAGTSTPSVTFKQNGEKLTGQYSSQLLGEAELVGTIKDDKIEFVVTGDVQGTKLQLKYLGTVEGKDAMKGQLSAGEFGDGTFTAKRKQ